MSLSRTAHAAAALTAALALQAFAAEVPGIGGNQPRVMVILDNSRSMEALPDNDYDTDCAANADGTGDDLFLKPDGGLPDAELVDPVLAQNNLTRASVCSAGAPGGAATAATRLKCRSKFCHGKRALYSAFDGWSDVLDVGVASYYQYLRRVKGAVPNTLTSTCTYDVLERSGEVARWDMNSPLGGGNQAFTFVADRNLTGSLSCFPTRLSTLSEARWERKPQCTNRNTTAGLTETAKTCELPTGSVTYDWSNTSLDVQVNSPADPTKAFYASAPPAPVALNQTTCTGDSYSPCASTTVPLPSATQTVTAVAPLVTQVAGFTNINAGTNFWLLERDLFPRTGTGANRDTFQDNTTHPLAAGACDTSGKVILRCTGTTPASCTSVGQVSYTPPGGTGISGLTNGNLRSWIGSANAGVATTEVGASCSVQRPCDFVLRWAANSATTALSYKWARPAAAVNVDYVPAGDLNDCTGPTDGPTNYYTDTQVVPMGTGLSCPSASISGIASVTSVNGFALQSAINCTNPTTASGGSGGAATARCDLNGSVVTATCGGTLTVRNGVVPSPTSCGGQTLNYVPVGGTWTDNFSYDIPSSAPANAQCPGAVSGSYTEATGSPWFCNGSTPCKANFVSRVDGPSDNPFRRCNYTVTNQNYEARYQRCQYTNVIKNYSCQAQTRCQYQTTRNRYRPTPIVHQWKTSAGEMVDKVVTPPIPAVDLSALTYNADKLAGFTGGYCPFKNTTDPKCSGGRECLLRWDGSVGTTAATRLFPTPPSSGTAINFTKISGRSGGRQFNFLTPFSESGTSGNLQRFCTAPDRTGGWAAATVGSLLRRPLPSDFRGDFVTASGNPGGAVPTLTHILSDPFDPGSQNDNMFPRYPGSAAETQLPWNPAANATAVEYSLTGDPTDWHSEPPLKKKLAGWSGLETFIPSGQINTGYAPNAPALSFVPMGPAAGLYDGEARIDRIKKVMQAYRLPGTLGASDPGNKYGLRMPDKVWSGANTPLVGTLQNAKDYIAEVLRNDPDSSCRPYVVVLITDGDNAQPQNVQHGNQSFAYSGASGSALVSAVTDLKNASGGGNRPKDNAVQTYVVAFGSGATSADPTAPINLMATAAGTNGNRAYNASGGTSLQDALNDIFSRTVNGRFTRSKPVVAQSGDATYFGFFEVIPGRIERKGYLNKYLTSAIVPTGGSSPVWEHDVQLNAMSASSRRVDVVLSNNTVRNLVQYSSWSNADKLRFATSTATDVAGAPSAATDALVKLVLNPTYDAKFQDLLRPARESRLGDIFHSSPVVLTPPSNASAWAGPDTGDMAAYDAFKSANANRQPRVLIGSNDGLMHGVCESSSVSLTDCGNGSATSGSESFAFIPKTAVPKLRDYYFGNQPAIVDGSFSAADLCLGASCAAATDWSTYVLGSLRAGGSSLYALKMSPPNANGVSTPTYQFEYSHPAMGDSWSAPVTAKVRLGGSDKWVAFVGGGVSTTPEVANGALLMDWTTGSTLMDGVSQVKWRIDMNAAGCDPTAGAGAGKCTLRNGSGTLVKNNIPGRFALSRQGKTAFVNNAYIGDSEGRVSRFNFISASSSGWTPAKFFDPSDLACANGLDALPAQVTDINSGSVINTMKNVFAQKTDPRSIFQRVAVGQDANGRDQIYFGTGDVNDPTFVASGNNASDYDYFFGLQDNNVLGSTANGACEGRPLWVKRLAKGQKVLSEAAVAGSVVFVPSYVPSTDPCNKLGDAVIYAFDRSTGEPKPALIDPTTGGATSKVTFIEAGIPADPVWVPAPGDPSGSTGKLIIGAADGKLRSITGNVGTGGNSVRGWKRVR